MFLCIDLKSFYASVECVDRGMDPLNTNLVVADESRTEKTICLAVTPALKSYGIPGRARLFEVHQATEQVNAQRRLKAKGGRFSKKSVLASELKADPNLELSFVIAPPRMKRYMEVSTQIFNIYRRYVSEEDIPEDLLKQSTAEDFYYTPDWSTETQVSDFDTWYDSTNSTSSSSGSIYSSGSSYDDDDDDWWSSSSSWDDDDDWSWSSDSDWDSGYSDWDSDW